MAPTLFGVGVAKTYPFFQMVGFAESNDRHPWSSFTLELGDSGITERKERKLWESERKPPLPPI